MPGVVVELPLLGRQQAQLKLRTRSPFTTSPSPSSPPWLIRSTLVRARCFQSRPRPVALRSAGREKTRSTSARTGHLRRIPYGADLRPRAPSPPPRPFLALHGDEGERLPGDLLRLHAGHPAHALIGIDHAVAPGERQAAPGAQLSRPCRGREWPTAIRRSSASASTPALSDATFAHQREQRRRGRTAWPCTSESVVRPEEPLARAVEPHASGEEDHPPREASARAWTPRARACGSLLPAHPCGIITSQSDRRRRGRCSSRSSAACAAVGHLHLAAARQQPARRARHQRLRIPDHPGPAIQARCP